MNRILLSAALLAAFTAVVHLFAGGADVAAPLLASTIDEVPKQTLYAVWHMVSAALGLSAPALLLGAMPRHAAAARYLVIFVAASWTAFGAVIVLIAALQPGPGWLLKLPQWILLLPVGFLGFWGLAASAPVGARQET